MKIKSTKDSVCSQENLSIEELLNKVTNLFDLINGSKPTKVTEINKNYIYLCPMISCNKVFKKTSSLKNHFISHGFAQKYTCHCGKSFYRNHDLSRHK
ncbi:hypothetical protein HK099_007580, partial [Clydaea vesicula]